MRVREVRADNNHDCCTYREGRGTGRCPICVYFSDLKKVTGLLATRRRDAANTRRDVSILYKLALHTLISLYVPYMYCIRIIEMNKFIFQGN